MEGGKSPAIVVEVKRFMAVAFHTDITGAREVVLASDYDAATQRAEQAERERDAANHLANEWADVATNGLQWLKNVADGTSTFSKAITDMGRDIQRVRAALPAPATNATGDV